MRKHTVWFVLGTILVASGCASSPMQRDVANVRTIEITRDLPYPAPFIFDRVFKDFAGIAKFHPGAADSGYVNPPTEPRDPIVGDTRFVWFEEDGSKVAYERLVEYEPESMRMRFQICDTKGLPLDTANTYGTSWLEPISPAMTRFRMRFEYRTKPQFLAMFAERGIRDDLNEMVLGIESYLQTDPTTTSPED